MHVIQLHAPRLEGEDHTKDIDFAPARIEARLQAGYADTRRVLETSPWKKEVGVTDGVILHEAPSPAPAAPAVNCGKSSPT